MFVLHPQLKDTIAQLQAALAHVHEGNGTEVLLVIAGSGAGKSTLCRHVRQLWPDEESADLTIRRVVEFKLPDPCTGANMAKQLLFALGDPGWQCGGATDNRARALELFKQCGTWVLLVDNFHDIPERRNGGQVRVIGNWFRKLIDDSQLVILALGLKEAEDVLLYNDQVQSRAPSTTHIDYFSLADEESRKRWLRVLYDLDGQLPLASSSNLHRADLAGRLFCASNGIFRYLAKLISRSMSIAVHRGSEQIEMVDLQAGFCAMFPSASRLSNPFDEDFAPRALNRVGEPFFQKIRRSPRHERPT